MSQQLGGTEMKRLHRGWRRRTEGRVALLLDGVQTPFNVGSIIRTAAAYRVEHLWLVAPSERPSHPKVSKTALGTDRYVPWTHHDDATPALDEVVAAGLAVVAIELTDAARPLHEIDLRAPTCLVFGHEDRGVSKAVLSRADAVAYLPQVGRVGSLNVASAAAIALYELRRQEWTATGER